MKSLKCFCKHERGLIDWLIDCLLACLLAWLIAWLIDWLIDWLTSSSNYFCCIHHDNKHTTTKDPTGKTKMVLGSIERDR